jgi:hypothetical protein
MLDWKTDSDYDFTSGLDQSGWAWEFLRRSKLYRGAWAEFLKRVSPWEATLGPYSEWKSKAGVLEAEPSLWGFDPPRQPNETVAQWKKRTFYLVAAEPIKEMLPEWEGRYWQLERMYNPFYALASDVKFRPADMPRVWHRWEDIRRYPQSYEDMELGAYTWFDLDRELAPQLDHIKKQLVAKQDALIAENAIHPLIKKTQKETWRHYLQLLDADNLGVSAKEIAASNIDDGFYQSLKDSKSGYDPVPRVRDRIQSARSIADLKYRTLLP